MQTGRTQAARGGVGLVEKQEVAGLFREGRLAEIVERAARLTACHPDDAFGWSVLSAALLRQGRDDQAVPPLRRALDLAPQEAGLHSNLGLALLGLGRTEEAMESFRRALAIDPGIVSARNNLGNALEQAGCLEEACRQYQDSLDLVPDQPRTLYNLANTLYALGRPAEALPRYRAALALSPDYAYALVNCGVALAALGRAAEAEDYARRALRCQPGLPEAQILLANILLGRGYPAQALAVVESALDGGERPELRRLFVTCLRGQPAPAQGSIRRERLLRALTEPWARSGEVAAVVAPMLEADPAIAGCLDRTLAAWPGRLSAQALYGPAGPGAVAGDTLLLAWLDAGPAASPALERFLTLARACLLAQAAADEPHEHDRTPAAERVTAFHAALARQCRINEYVFAVTAEEEVAVAVLRDCLAAALAGCGLVPPSWVLAVAAYGPLRAVPGHAGLLERPWPEAVRRVLEQQIAEPAAEQELRGRIPQLTPIEDDVSRLVRRQYEENPYPRWVRPAPAERPVRLVAQLRERFPRADLTGIPDGPGLDVLIAGCGTGQHSLETARAFLDARVLAVDLSLTSLCYARRKTLELGVANIEYAQADLLRLGEVGRTFDLVESSGVLHHLADPAAGWRALLPLVRPGGVMRIGLYSRLARRGIARVRALIAERGLPGTPEAIRAFRQELLDTAWEPSWGRYLLGDFFSTSGCRDLLFHVQEHCLDLLEIKTFCLDNGLRVLGVEAEPAVAEAYRSRFPDDPAAVNLSHWHAFEADNPDTFLDMYQFWVQRIA
jgi:Tfp pilus assembly protein PilF/2-polyprenyl-3-methyl-5-hydroxy-6-metoxy-1,4-benzoquinol methylase